MADDIRDQARHALTQGEAASEAGDLDTARDWLERARRIVPADPAILLLLGAVLLRQRDPAAQAVFAAAAAKADMSEIWQGLAAAALVAGDLPAARAALHHVLADHVLPADPTAVIALLGATGITGWVGVARDATGLVVHTDLAHAALSVDGRSIETPALPETGARLDASDAEAALFASPIDLRRLRAVEGFVAAESGGLAGWAWLPHDAASDPWITVTDARGQALRLQATGDAIAPHRPMARPRGFALSAAQLAGFDGPLRITCNGPLAGSPVDPAAAPRAARDLARLIARTHPAIGPAEATGSDHLALPLGRAFAPAEAPCDLARPVAIVIPVYADRPLTAACLDSVFATCRDPTVIVVDDSTPDPALADDLDALAGQGRITLLRHADNRGFPTAANAGLRAAFALHPPHDALLLNSDTLLPGNANAWLDRLRSAVQAAPDIGTASPLSNDATILSYPLRDGPNPPPDAADLARLDAQAAAANAGEVVDIPTTVGFCLYLRHECAIETGLFRATLFGQGYGEENDLCLRASHLGWRHVAVPGVVVAHVGGASFGATRAARIACNLAELERLHPGYHALIAAYQRRIPAEDALAPARRRIDALRWTEGRRDGATLLLTHDTGGGVERVVQARARAIEADGGRAILLRPIHDPDSPGGFMPGLCGVSDLSGAHPNLVFRLPDELPALADLLRPDRPALLEVHHRLGHPPSVIKIAALLGLPVDHIVHDYAAFCPRVTLIGAERRYCGEPVAVAACEACIADAGSRTGETIAVAALRARSAAEFAQARRIAVPSADMAGRLRRHFPALRPETHPLEDDAALPQPPPPAFASGQRLRVCVIGAIGIEKGFDVLLACARDAAWRDLPLEFRLAGHSTDDGRLIDTGRVFVTGRYGEAEAEALVRAQSAQLAFLPSIWPETWGFTLGLAWRCGLNAAVFDLGAMAARVRATGRGVLLPLGLPAAAINQALLRAVPHLPAHPGYA